MLSLSLLITAQLIVLPENSSHRLKLETAFVKARDLFEKEVGKLTEDVVVEIDPPSCLRTGYNRKTKKVIFCPNAKVLNSGLESIDVINHELFHAFLCQTHKKYCENDERSDVHEALADVFAYRLNPDENFGEDFYKNLDYIRSYHTDWRVGLVRTPHERGMALASFFIHKKFNFFRMLEYFKKQNVQEVKDMVGGIESSDLNRYRLSSMQEIEIEFFFSQGLEAVRVEWSQAPGLDFIQVNSRKFCIKNRTLHSSEKVRARFVDDEGREIGGWNFYFGPKI
jgi:hypothetical protein